MLFVQVLQVVELLVGLQLVGLLLLVVLQHSLVLELVVPGRDVLACTSQAR
jgi:hypothetical protein